MPTACAARSASTTYINTFARAGLLAERLSEPIATGRRAAEVPGNLEAPSILVVRWALR